MQGPWDAVPDCQTCRGVDESHPDRADPHGWHWLAYNFNPKTPGFVTVGGPTVMALATGDAVMPGFAAEQLKRLESFGGLAKKHGHYQQILAWYCEVLVVAHLLTLQAWCRRG